MAKNNLIDLRNHLFAQLERLGDDQDMKNPLVREREIQRADSISKVAQVIVNTAKLEVDMMKALKDAPVSMNPPTFLGLNK
jgi:hypothetical protein